MHARMRIRGYWPTVLWAVLVIVIAVQSWWSMFGLRHHEAWTFLEFSVVLAQTATLYLMAAIVLPEEVTEGGVDLRAYYERHHRWFFGWFLATLAISVLKDVILGHRLPGAYNLAFHGILAAGCIAAFFVRRYRLHQILGVGFAVVIAAYIGLLFTRLQ